MAPRRCCGSSRYILIRTEAATEITLYVSIQFIVGSDHDKWGTPQMMAPELWSEETPAVHPSADIFALGILLWEMASRQRPWCETP
eukprot:COSAG01_NODE_1452_length_10260_cov_26.827970_19_plen_86_part_00